jgi:hypothetical protein
VKVWPFDVLVLFLKCVQFLMDTTEYGNSSVSDEDKGRRAHQTRVSYLNKREMCIIGAHLLSQ